MVHQLRLTGRQTKLESLNVYIKRLNLSSHPTLKIFNGSPNSAKPENLCRLKNTGERFWAMQSGRKNFPIALQSPWKFQPCSIFPGFGKWLKRRLKSGLSYRGGSSRYAR